MAVDIVILAAGKGTRMKSSQPKVLHKLAGRPLLRHVIDSARTFDDAALHVVVGHGAEMVRTAIPDNDIHWVEQTEQLGTGHAVQQVLPWLRDNAATLVLYGDVPLIRAQTLSELVALVNHNTLSLLTVRLDNPKGYGRIIRDDSGHVCGIVEEKDANELQKGIDEVNTGVMAIPPGRARQWLNSLNNNNAQGEYYLTDLIAIAHEHGITIKALQPASAMETEGVNSRLQLHALERYHQRQQAETLLAEGVTLADINRFDCRGTLRAGIDSYIDINCIFEGTVTLGREVRIGPNCLLRNVEVSDGVVIKANTVIEGPVTIAAGAEVGPFARLRPGTSLAEAARVGNFVEVKKSAVGRGSKINHLSYVGDATLGEDVNIGAGTITCNYDGANKYSTTIGDNAFVGSNSALVAPVTVGAGATIAAGSTVTRDVADGQLAVARSRQTAIKGWKRPTKNKD